MLDVAGQWVDRIKWAGGSFGLLPREQVRAFSDVAHEHDAYLSSGDWVETVLRYGPNAVEHYLAEAKEIGFDVIEISTGFLSMPTSGLLRLVEQVIQAGLNANPELRIQFCSGGDSTQTKLAAEGKEDVGVLIDRARNAPDTEADIIIKSEGTTENVSDWNTGAVASIINGIGLDRVLFEAAVH